MFAKLLKHEFRATRSMVGLLCLTSLGLGVAGGGAGWYQYSHECTQMMSGLLGMVSMVCALSILFCAAGAIVVLLVHFYKSRFTDQGYLTFTLPVSTQQNLLAGTTNMVLNILLVTVSMVLAFVVMFVLAMCMYPEFWTTLWEEFPLFWDKVMEHLTPEVVGQIFLGILTIILSCLCQLILVMTSMTVGAFIAKKHKVLSAIVVYYLCQILLPLAAFRIMIEATKFVQVVWALNIVNVLAILIGYFLMYFLMSRKLNLP